MSHTQIIEQQLLNVRPRLAARLSDFEGECYAGLRSAAAQLLAGQLTSLYIHAPAGNGRSHFLSALCAAAEQQGLSAMVLPFQELLAYSPEILEGLEEKAVILCDDVDALVGQPAWEEALFHLYNRSRSREGRWVFSAALPPRQLGVLLPDLVSRLQQASCWHLSLPDDTSRRTLLLMAAQRRGIRLDPVVLEWVLKRAPRQPAALLAWLDDVDQRSLSVGRGLTIPVLTKLLDEIKSGR